MMKRTCLVLLIVSVTVLPALRAAADKQAAAVPAQPPTHWAFVPPQRPAPPVVRQSARLRTPVDAFIEAALEEHGLSLSAEADRATLIRRVSFDLTGLPPTPEETAAFLEDHSLDAYERMVERYLASPRYGERWGKYWLDAAGYADSNGYFSADTDRPLAYRYRDYVIRAFNADKPYDRFVQEQLAGDELAGYSAESDLTGETLELLTATHFLRNAPDGSGESDGNPDEVRTDRFTVLEGNLQIAMNCLLGMTIQCARCHSHKFEPIQHEEYYRLQAILFPVYNPERWSKPNERVLEIGTRAQREEFRQRSEKIERQLQALQAGLRTMAEPLMEQVLEERLQKVEPKERAAILEAFRTPKEKRTEKQEALLKQYARNLKVSDDELAKRYPEYGAVRTQVQKAIAERRKELPPPLEKVAVVIDADPKPPAHHLLKRGVHNAPGPEVQPGVPACLDVGQRFRLASPPVKNTTGRRLAFARWVTAPENPLFARVMVNRIWQRHFGVGLITTPDNLGQSGARPSHPDLLDYLAMEFMNPSPQPSPPGGEGAGAVQLSLRGGEGRVRGWSIKSLHRLIMTSAVYRQSSATRDEALAVDPENRWLWHFPLRRLDAEAVRDGMLAVAGELDGRMGGPYVPTKRAADGSVVVDEARSDARRRSIYLQQRRTQVMTLLELFDAPAMATTCGTRTSSTVPLQSLALLNSAFARARAQGFAGRLLQDANATDDRRVDWAFQLACGRRPLAEERSASLRFLATQRRLYPPEKEGETQTWTDFCQMVLASNAFLYIE